MKRFITLITTMALSTSIRLCGCADNCKQTITSIETMTLTLQGMRFCSVYEITNEDGKTELRRFRKVYSNGVDTLELEASAVCDITDFIELMNTCGVICWDGFHGKHPKNVKDGIMFDFRTTVNNGQEIHADGSENFPKGYHDFVRELNKILTEHGDD